MSSSVLTVFDQQLWALSSKGDLSVPVDIFDTYTHTHIHIRTPFLHASGASAPSPFKGNESNSLRALQGG